ncbi:MAG: glycosyltransferase family 2 protein [Acidobacteriota bacterium]
MTDLTIVIVSYNTRQELDACLAALAAHPPQTSHEVVVVDNASTDGTAAAVAERWPGVRLIRTERNVGFAAGNNLGIRASSSQYVLLLNSDTLVPDGAIDRLVERLNADPNAAAAGPRIVDGAGKAELSFGRMMSPFHEARQKLIVKLHDAGFAPVSRYVERITREPSNPDWVSGACLLVCREDAVAAGLLDERYFLYAEDVDFCAALRATGNRIWFTPDVEIVHHRGRAGRQRPAATELAYRRAQLAFYAKHHPAWVPWLRAYLRLCGKLPPS